MTNRAQVEFDPDVDNEWERLVMETLETSDFIETEPVAPVGGKPTLVVREVVDE